MLATLIKQCTQLYSKTKNLNWMKSKSKIEIIIYKRYLSIYNQYIIFTARKEISKQIEFYFILKNNSLWNYTYVYYKYKLRN